VLSIGIAYIWRRPEGQRTNRDEEE
jgi:hypothetical protein